LSLYEYATCVTDQQIQCNEDLFQKYLNTNSDFDCTHKCPLECNQTTFVTTMSFGSISGYSFVDKINENENLKKDFGKRPINEGTARESVIKVNLYYDSLSYELSTESPKMTLADLLASIGGNLGLFMGMSLMSFSEILEVLLEIIIIKLRN
jgi:hypothetical protein